MNSAEKTGGIDISRVYNKKIEIDNETVKGFFEGRFNKDNPYSVMLQKDSILAKKRDEAEKNRILPLLSADEESSILDLGCGMGRWAEMFTHAKHYLGVDYVEDYITACNEKYKGESNINFQVMSANDIEKDKLLVSSFNIAIITGLMVYLNDDECECLLEKLSGLVDSSSKIYLRESVSIIGERLSLKDFYSKELNSSYNAIYRTPEEYQHLINKHLVKSGFNMVVSDLLLKGQLANRKETNQQFFLLERL